MEGLLLYFVGYVHGYMKFPPGWDRKQDSSNAENLVLAYSLRQHGSKPAQKAAWIRTNTTELSARSPVTEIVSNHKIRWKCAL